VGRDLEREAPPPRQSIEHSIVIAAPPAVVWEWLTRPERMQRWMAEPDAAFEVTTDWTVGGPITIRGFHHARFENRGTVTRFDPVEALGYTHLSSLSRLPDEPANHSRLDFRLAPSDGGTALTVALAGFPTESILKHMDFYWRGTLQVLKRLIEGG